MHLSAKRRGVSGPSSTGGGGGVAGAGKGLPTGSKRKKKKLSRLKRIVAQERVLRWTDAKRQALAHVEKLQRGILHKQRDVQRLVSKFSAHQDKLAQLEAAARQRSDSHNSDDGSGPSCDDNDDDQLSEASEEDGLFAAVDRSNRKHRKSPSRTPLSLPQAQAAAAQTRALIQRRVLEIHEAEAQVEQIMSDFGLNSNESGPTVAEPEASATAAAEGVADTQAPLAPAGARETREPLSHTKAVPDDQQASADAVPAVHVQELKGAEVAWGQFVCVATAGGVLYRKSGDMENVVKPKAGVRKGATVVGKLIAHPKTGQLWIFTSHKAEPRWLPVIDAAGQVLFETGDGQALPRAAQQFEDGAEIVSSRTPTALLCVAAAGGVVFRSSPNIASHLKPKAGVRRGVQVKGSLVGVLTIVKAPSGDEPKQAGQNSRLQSWIRTVHKGQTRWLPIVGSEGEVLFVEHHETFKCVHPKGVVYRVEPHMEAKKAKAGVRSGKSVNCAERVDMQWIRVDDSKAGSVFLPLYNDDFGTLFEPSNMPSGAPGVASLLRPSAKADSNEHPGKSVPRKHNAQAVVSLKEVSKEPRINKKDSSSQELIHQPTVERRIDVSDGGAYSFAEFEAFYGVDAAKTLWNMAQRLPEFSEKDSKGGNTGNGRAQLASAEEGNNEHPEGRKKRRRRRRHKKKKTPEQLAAAQKQRDLEEHNKHIRSLVDTGSLPPKFLPESAEQQGFLQQSRVGSWLATDANLSAQALMVRKGDNVRSYVTQELDPSLDERVFSMLEKLWAFQIRAFKKDPVKARHYGKRLVMGLREARRDARAGKLKAVVVSPNIDDSVSAGGLNDKVAEIMGICVERQVPVIFALSRRRMARAVGKSQRISVVGIINADGANDDFKAALVLTRKLRQSYLTDPEGTHKRNIDLKNGGGTTAALRRKEQRQQDKVRRLGEKEGNATAGNPASEEHGKAHGQVTQRGSTTLEPQTTEVPHATTEKAAQILGLTTAAATEKNTRPTLSSATANALPGAGGSSAAGDNGQTSKGAYSTGNNTRQRGAGISIGRALKLSSGLNPEVPSFVPGGAAAQNVPNFGATQRMQYGSNNFAHPLTFGNGPVNPYSVPKGYYYRTPMVQGSDLQTQQPFQATSLQQGQYPNHPFSASVPVVHLRNQTNVNTREAK